MTEPSDPRHGGEQPEERMTPQAAAEFADMLRHAYTPKSLSPERNQALIDAALEDPLRHPSAEELVESERFRRALDAGAAHPAAELARQLAALHRSDCEPATDLDALSDRALSRAFAESARQSEDPPNQARRSASAKLITVSFGLVSTLAAAAAIVLSLTSPSPETGNPNRQQASPTPVRPGLTQSRSAATLFDQKFERTSTTSRVDRIASARSRELRDNRFRQWGVR